MRDARQLLHDARFADAGLTGDEHRLRYAGLGELPGVNEALQLRVATDEAEHVVLLDVRGEIDVERDALRRALRLPEHLARADRVRQPLQLYFADPAQLHADARPAEHTDNVRDEDLPSGCRRAKPRSLDDGRSEPVSVL